MGKITKALQTKHKETLSPWLQEFVDTATSTPLPLLPQTLATFPSRWPFPRGDLYHWIPLLNRFDVILETFCQIYKLNEGPQIHDFGCEVLLHLSTDGSTDLQKLSEHGYSQDGDVVLIESVLKFTQMLLDHCGNRSIYLSSSHLNDLLNSTDFRVICATLQVGVELAQRYQASVKRMHGAATRQMYSALLSNHYNIDLDRVQHLAQPFVKTPIVKLPESPSLLTTTGSGGKGKDKSTGGNSKNAASMFANDLCAIAKPDPHESQDSPSQWSEWADIKLTYYPSSSNSAQEPQQSLSADRQPNAPSTPTPLRRSNSAQGSSTPTRMNRQAHGGAEDSPGSANRSTLSRDEAVPHGQQSLEVPKSTVMNSSIYQLLAKVPEDLPKETRYEFLNRLRVAKALIGSVETRQHALKARLLAIQNLAYIQWEGTFVEKVLGQDSDEPRRFQLIYQLAELIHPGSGGTICVPLDLQSIALALLEAMASFHSKVPDIFSALNATVNHGVLLYVIRKAVSEMKVDDAGDQWTSSDEWRDKLFSLTLHITMTMANTSARQTPEIITAGLLEVLVEILNIRSSIAERHYGILVGFLDTLVYNVQTSFQSLASAGGLDAITNLITHEVNLAKKLVGAGKGTPASHQSQVVDYEIPFYQQHNLKFLLKFIHHLMTNAYSFGGNTDRLLRNLVDKSDLLQSIREIIENMTQFGSLVWTNAVTILSDFLNNDPTSFSAIFEAGLIQSYLTALTGRSISAGQPTETATAQTENENEQDSPTSSPDANILEPDERAHPPTEEILEQPRDHTLASGILTSIEPMSTVPTVLNAISLNNQGMKMVVSAQAFDSFFEIFESPEHVQIMTTEDTLPQNLGSSFDELSRHHPALRPAIANAVLDMIARVKHLGCTKARDSKWGAKLVAEDIDGQETATDFSLLSTAQGKDKTLATSDDADVDMVDADTHNGHNLEHKLSDTSPVYTSFSPYISSVAEFLHAYIQNANLKNSLIHNGGIELLLDLYTSPSLPHDFGKSSAAKSLQSVLSSLIESSPIIGLPSLLRRTQASLDHLDIVVKAQDTKSFFAPFLVKNAMPNSLAASDMEKQLAEGTAVVKALLNAQSLIKVLCRSFPFSNRAQTVTLPAVNVYDYHTHLIKSLGPLLRAVVLEETAMSATVPQQWYSKDGDNHEKSTSSENEEEGLVRDLESASLLDVLSSANIWKLITSSSSQDQKPSDSEKTGPYYQNFQTIKVLFQSFLPTALPLFQAYGRSLLHRRERDTYVRSHHLQLAEHLTATVLNQFLLNSHEISAKEYHYWYIMLHAVHDLLVNRTTENRAERPISAQIMIPVLLAFKKRGGIEMLNLMLRELKNEICKEHKSDEEAAKSTLAALCMKKILDLYTMITNGKIIADAIGQVNILPHRASGNDRRPDSQITPNLVVEIRAIVLPVVQELWDSPLIERGSATVVAKTIEILKLISSADYEGNAYKRSDKTPPPGYLELSVQKFSWSTYSDETHQLSQSLTYPEDLVREAIYRGLGNLQIASEYCKAHEKGIAGPRNPIPETDIPQTSEIESHVDEGDATIDNDSMVLDLPPDLPPGILDEELIGNLRNASVVIPAPAFQNQASSDLVSQSASPAQSAVAGAKSDDESPAIAPQAYAKEDLDEQRAKLRSNLIDRCLDVIGAHPDSTHEVAELISSILLQSPGDDQSSRQEIGDTLVNALLSFALDDDIKSNARSIAAYAHLLSLLLQENAFFKASVGVLTASVSEFLRFLQISSSSSSEELSPWIPYILLIFEILLSDDEHLGEIKWKAPEHENDAIESLEWNPREFNVKTTDRKTLLDLILEILPRIGREENLAISVLRILVILTRDREVARQVGDKKNLQRLFVTAKQLSGIGSQRLNESRLSTYILTILRHIIEDEEIIKQYMRNEIRTYFDGTRNSRPQEVAAYLGHFSHLVLRDAKLFVEVSNELLKLSRWLPRNDSRQQAVVLKESSTAGTPKDDVAPAVQATEDLSIQDVKPSTEGEEKQQDETTKSMSQEAKRSVPVIENPDGVIHFLLCELINYKEVEDKDVSQLSKDTSSTTEREQGLAASNSTTENENRPAESKDKKGKTSFKPDEHPIFIYRCFLLHCLTELLGSYNRTKVEFINFKRNAPLFANTPVKPRSSVLNYLLHDLLYPSHLDPPQDSILHKKKYATAIQAQQLLLALVSKTGERWFGRSREAYDYEEEPDLLFVRKFVLDTILKSYKDASTSNDPFESRYTRMLALAEVMQLIVGDKEKDPTGPLRSSHDTLDHAAAQMRRLMYEKGYLAALTSSIADIDLAFPPVKRTIKYILRVLRVLTSTAIHLSHSNIISSVPTQDSNEEDLISASSLSDMGGEREETPDLYRNSTLGMLEPGRDALDDYSEDSEDDEDDDTEMYDEEYDEDDIPYDSGGDRDREEDVSDQDDEEELDGMGPIEGLPGDVAVEVEMSEDEDEDDDEDDEMDDGDDDDDDVSENDEESVDMNEAGGHIELEFAGGEGNPLDDDGEAASDWESETDEAIAEEEEELDYEAATQDLDEADIHELDDVDGLGRFGNIMRVIGEASDFQAVEDLDNLEERYMEEGEDDEVDDDEDEYAYEEDFPNDPPPRDIIAPSLGWDTLVVDHGPIFGTRRRHGHLDRNPVPLPFMMGQRDLHHFTDSRVRGGHSRDARGSTNESVVNPLLRRLNDNSRDVSPRPSLQYVRGGNSSQIGLPANLFASNSIASPMNFLNDLVASLPTVGRYAHALHFTIGGRRANLADLPFPFGSQTRETRSDGRRDTFQEPIQSTTFNTESAINRWTDEVKMIFGSQEKDQAIKVLPALLSYLVPPAILQEKKLQAEEQRIAEAKQKKREEEERKAREAKEAEEKAAQELKEAEERERAAAAEAAAAAAAAEAQTMVDSAHDDAQSDQSQIDTMEGIEQPSIAPDETQEATITPNQPRSFTTIRGEQVDVTELGIDPDYLEALPEEFREEVIAQTVSSRRAEAREAPRGTGEQTEVFQEFLDALPDDLRQEIVQQERQEQRRRDREEARRQASAAGQAAEAQDMDAASILLTFPPALREQVLLDQGADIVDSLPPDMAAQARRILRAQAQPPSSHSQPPASTSRTRDLVHALESIGASTAAENKTQRKAVVQMLDKPGVATLLRLMFMNMKEYPIANTLKHLFKDVCENRQTRVEVISTLLQILQDGSTDLDAVERSFAHLSIRAKQPKDKDLKTQTPQGLKRTFTNISNHNSAHTNSDTSPVLIVQQCLDLLCYLAHQNVHVPSLFLTEHDAVASTVKRSLSRKGKNRDQKAQKYAINSLLSLLDRDLVMESSAIMDSLSQLLSRVTYPLLALDRKKKEAEESIKDLEAELKAAKAEGKDTTHNVSSSNSGGEAAVVDTAASSGANQTSEQEPQSQEPSAGSTGDGAEPSTSEEASNAESKALEKRQAALKRIRQLNPPSIPIPNLTLIINIFVARECSSKTFKETLSTIKNLSIMDGAMMIFGKELARQAEILSKKIVVHLDELLPHIQNAGSGTEIQGVALSKFSPGASDQNKLLRVLTALDHLFAQKKTSGAEESSVEETDKDKTIKEDLLSTLYRNTTFNALWAKLSACLSVIRQRDSLLNVATILLPLIEALMVVCKDSAQAENVEAKGQAAKDMVLSSPQPEDRMAGLFFTFTEDHKRILNELVRNNPSLMKGTFSNLVKNPKVLEFDNKRNWFNRSVHNKQQATHRPFPSLQLQVRREHVFHDSFKSLYFKSGDEMKFGKLNIRFHGEEGVDAGGVTREWFQVLARQMFDPNYALFVPVSSDRTTFHPNKLSGINDEHLMFFKFIGRVIGKALYEGRLLDCYFSRAVYKRILGKPVSVKDMESFDPEYYKSLSWMLDNDITDIITETFSVEDDEFGVTKIEDLREDGRNIPVTEDNKHEYVRLVVEHKLLSSVKEQMENFLKGFHEIIPAELISIFNEQELELLISGLPDVDIDDWKSNTEYHNYSPSSPQIQWFWRALRSFDKEEVAKLLQFVTGTSKVPLNGFKELEGMNGINRFNIHRDYGNKDRLPSSHTCFNQLDLPEYESYEILRRQLMKAITTGSDYFGFA
ncbi:hypothetical protein F5Y16DRAFT_108436 [Xylariaceae sp. FL0255]|nr:hypothetical protein F5Y16DRAFT_108436 [Xylariaceae sp. FL0255]